MHLLTCSAAWLFSKLIIYVFPSLHGLVLSAIVIVQHKFRDKFGKKLPVHNTIKAIHTKLDESVEAWSLTSYRPLSSRTSETASEREQSWKYNLE